ncbi:MAG: CoB--CoM heterodisulfide reductase iron-sulfur subunit B family protein [Proteobacteria bacterium]|nr:CoB--CoM heterodisulfide reductase iron-sulfur subunit B family protein [Pseudomonadota bacterium]
MKYAYYPGCSLTGTAVEFDASTRALLARLGADLVDIPDWTCCGASAGQAVSELLAFALPARNLALAERDLAGRDVLAPCSACYLNLLAAREEARADRALSARVEEVLLAEGLTWENFTEVRHLLDVLAFDVGPDAIAGQISHSLEGFSLAPYYGCQTLRPYAQFDDPERPVSMEAILTATGAHIHTWDKGARCCGASLATTHRAAALPRIQEVLDAATGADAIVTVCPMCQMNLESFQKQAGIREPMTILYLPQLLGLAMGLSRHELMLDKNLALTRGFMDKFTAGPPPPPVPEEEGVAIGEAD